MNLEDKIKDRTIPIHHEGYTMSELVEGLVGGVRATSGNRNALTNILQKYNVEHIPQALPSSGYERVILNRLKKEKSEAPELAGKPKDALELGLRPPRVTIENNIMHITIDLEVENYNKIKNNLTLYEIIKI